LVSATLAVLGMIFWFAEVEACCGLRKAKGLGPLSVNLEVEPTGIGGFFKLAASVY
jgi:hypothetical protein